MAKLIDFGTAGPGDPAKDLAVPINSYGEHLLRRMQAVYAIPPALLDRARFFAGSIELEWALAGIVANNPEMFLVHLGRACDVLPIGVRWV
jgi:aminoglycoside phosphotransferase (APT) family kinase protein